MVLYLDVSRDSGNLEIENPYFIIGKIHVEWLALMAGGPINIYPKVFLVNY